MSSCSCRRMTLPLLLGMMVILCWLGESSDLQAQSTEGKPNIQKKWTYNAPGDAWFGEPRPAGDAVYFITSDDHLIAIDSTTGQLRWRFDPGTGKRYSPEHMGACAVSFPAPAVFGALVLFSSSAGIYAIEAQTGTRKWSFITEAVLMSEPVFADGKVFFKTDEGDLCALDAVTGAKKWGFVPEANCMNWLSEPVILDGKVFIATEDGDLWALDADTGAKNWSVKMPASISELTVGAGVVMYPSWIGGSTIAFDLETGRQRWKWNQTVKGDDGRCHGMRIQAIGDRVFVGAGGCGQVAALDSLTGELVWDAQLQTQQDNAGIFLKAATLETVIAQTEDGNIYAFSAATGNLKWRFSTGCSRMDNTVRIDADTVYILHNNGYLCALEEDTGKRKWEAILSGQKPSRSDDDGFFHPQYVAVSSGLIFVVGPDGSLTAYGN